MSVPAWVVYLFGALGVMLLIGFIAMAMIVIATLKGAIGKGLNW